MASNSKLNQFSQTGLGLLTWCGVFWVILQLGGYFGTLLALLGVSVVFSYILLAPVNLLQRAWQWVFTHTLAKIKSLPFNNSFITFTCRGLSILTVYLAFIALALIVFFSVTPRLTNQFQGFVADVTHEVESLENWCLEQPWSTRFFRSQVQNLADDHKLTLKEEETLKKEQKKGLQVPNRLSHTERQIVKNYTLDVSQPIQGLAQGQDWSGTMQNVFSLLHSTVAALVFTILILVLTFYFLLDGKELTNACVSLLPEEWQDDADHFLEEVHRVMFGFIKGQVFLGLITGVFMFVVYSAFGIPYAFLLSAFFAVAEILPIVGIYIGYLPGLLYLLFTQPIDAFWVSLIIYGYHLIKDHTFAPRVMGNVLGLHPVTVMLSLLICGQVGGLLGILYAIPLASILNVCIQWSIARRKARRTEQGTPAPC